MTKEKARDDEMTKKKEGNEKEFADPEIRVEGTKSAETAEETDKSEKAQPQTVTIDKLIPLLRKKGMKI